MRRPRTRIDRIETLPGLRPLARQDLGKRRLLDLQSRLDRLRLASRHLDHVRSRLAYRGGVDMVVEVERSPAPLDFMDDERRRALAGDEQASRVAVGREHDVIRPRHVYRVREGGIERDDGCAVYEMCGAVIF